MIRLLLEQPQQGESSQILARTKLRAVVQRMGLSAVQGERAELVCTEILSNQQKHGRGGLLQLWESSQPVRALEVFALDYGAGIPELHRAFEDGYTTKGTLGRGLGAIRRLADAAAVYSVVDDGRKRPWHGVAVWARFLRESGPDLPYRVGGFLRAYHDDAHNGDLITVQADPDGLAWLHMDGLGHGQEAAAAVAGVDGVLEPGGGPEAVMDRVSRALQGQRGGVGIAGELQGGQALLCGVGDLAAATVDGAKHAVPFAPGVLGHAHRSFETQKVALGPETVVLTASDGIRRTWEMAAFPGLWTLHPQMVALLMGNVLGRNSDDKSLFVAAVNKGVE